MPIVFWSKLMILTCANFFLNFWTMSFFLKRQHQKKCYRIDLYKNKTPDRNIDGKPPIRELREKLRLRKITAVSFFGTKFQRIEKAPKNLKKTLCGKLLNYWFGASWAKFNMTLWTEKSLNFKKKLLIEALGIFLSIIFLWKKQFTNIMSTNWSPEVLANKLFEHTFFWVVVLLFWWQVTLVRCSFFQSFKFFSLFVVKRIKIVLMRCYNPNFV